MCRSNNNKWWKRFNKFGNLFRNWDGFNGFYCKKMFHSVAYTCSTSIYNTLYECVCTHANFFLSFGRIFLYSSIRFFLPTFFFCACAACLCMSIFVLIFHSKSYGQCHLNTIQNHFTQRRKSRTNKLTQSTNTAPSIQREGKMKTNTSDCVRIRMRVCRM